MTRRRRSYAARRERAGRHSHRGIAGISRGFQRQSLNPPAPCLRGERSLPHDLSRNPGPGLPVRRSIRSAEPGRTMPSMPDSGEGASLTGPGPSRLRRPEPAGAVSSHPGNGPSRFRPPGGEAALTAHDQTNARLARRSSRRRSDAAACPTADISQSPAPTTPSPAAPGSTGGNRSPPIGVLPSTGASATEHVSASARPPPSSERS